MPFFSSGTVASVAVFAVVNSFSTLEISSSVISVILSCNINFICCKSSALKLSSKNKVYKIEVSMRFIIVKPQLCNISVALLDQEVLVPILGATTKLLVLADNISVDTASP